MKKLVPIIGCIVILVAAFVTTDMDESSRIVDGLKIARLAVDAKEAKKISGWLENGMDPWEVSTRMEYRRSVEQLKRIAAAFPVTAKWTYIATTSGIKTHERLIVLTIDAERLEKNTLPGTLYNVESYPAMRDAVYGDHDTVVSGIVYDSVYNIWTRSGFVKIYDAGELVGALGVDIDASQIFARVLSAILATVVYSCVFLLAFFYMSDSYRLTKANKDLLRRLSK